MSLQSHTTQSSLSWRLLPWTLLVVLAFVSEVLYLRAPKGDFEFDLRDPKLAKKPAAGYFEVVRAKLQKRAEAENLKPMTIILKLEGQTQRARFAPPLAMGPIDFVTVSPMGNGAVIGGTVSEGPYVKQRRVTLKGCAHLLRDYFSTYEAAGIKLYVTHGPPDCTMRQWADFLRMGEEEGVAWGAYSSPEGSRPPRGFLRP